jgi:hypothetical protein
MIPLPNFFERENIMEAVYGTAMLCILAGAVLVLIYGWEPE